MTAGRVSPEQIEAERGMLIAFLSVRRTITPPKRMKVDRARVMELRSKRFTVEQIAQMVGCSAVTVWKICRAART